MIESQLLKKFPVGINGHKLMITANNKNRDVNLSEFNEFLNRRILKNLNKIKKNKTDKNKKPKNPVSANN
tara:strand:+ start:270 stop:479 length:210 start_codon:yes stop_codon:yes gene_type:complete